MTAKRQMKTRWHINVQHPGGNVETVDGSGDAKIAQRLVRQYREKHTAAARVWMSRTRYS